MRTRTNSDTIKSRDKLWLVFFIPGLLLTLFSFYILGLNGYRQIAWVKTTGKVVGLEERGYSSDNFPYVHERVEFVNGKGESIKFVNPFAAGTSDANWALEGEVTVYYNPENNEDAVMFSFRNYAGVFCLPFGILLLILGQPLPKK